MDLKAFLFGCKLRCNRTENQVKKIGTRFGIARFTLDRTILKSAA